MFEKKSERLLPFSGFLVRMGLTLLAAMGFAAVALSVGILGYHYIAGLGWIDAILNASMILTGMGPVDPMKDTASKLFASAYALFSGVVFISAIGMLMSPVIHRIMHVFHMDGEGK